MSVSSPHHCGLDGDRQAAGDRRRTCPQAGAQRRMTAGRLSCFARNGRSPGEESRPTPLRHRRSRRSRPAARSAHRRGRMERSIRQRRSRRTLRLHRAGRDGGGAARGAHPASRRAAASMLPMSKDRRATGRLPSRAWRLVARANTAFQHGPRPMGRRDPALIHTSDCQQARRRSQAA